MNEDAGRVKPGESLDWLKRFSQSLGTPKKQLSPDVKQLGSGLLAQAKADLREFRKKYDSKDYSRSVFWLQQAAEKATKGLLILLGAIQKDDLKRNVGHLTPMAFLQIYESNEFDWMPDFIKWLENLANTKGTTLSFDVSEVRKIILQDRPNIARLTPAQVEALIQLAQSFKTRLLPLIPIRWELYRLSTIEKSSTETKELIAKGDYKGIGKPIVAMFRLYIIGLITFPHSDTTRYPSNGLSPITYTPELGIVARATTLASMLKTSLRELEYYSLGKERS